MLSSKDRAALRSQANSAETILHIGKSGVTEAVVAQAREALAAREVCDALCQALGAEPVQTIGTVFVLYKKAPEQAKAKPRKNPVREGAKARRQSRKDERERRNEFFREQAIQQAIERRIARENRD